MATQWTTILIDGDSDGGNWTTTTMDYRNYGNVPSALTSIVNRNCSMTTWMYNQSVVSSVSEENCTKGFITGDELSSLSMIMLMLFYVLVFLVGVCGNTLVIYVVLRYNKMQTVTNTYILNLALADECFLIGLPFLVATMKVSSWTFGHVMCKLYMTTTSINQFTSSLFLTVMSADRYIAVCHPITSPQYRTPLISKIVCLTAWTASALMMVPIFMYAGETRVEAEDRLSCNILWPGKGNLDSLQVFTLYTFTLGFAIPLTLIFIFYLMVIRRLKTVGPRNKSKERKKSHRKVTKLVLTVIAVYVFCWLPYWIMQVTLISTPHSESYGSSKPYVLAHLFASCLSYSNSAVNPILYAFLSENFKKSFVKACICAGGKEVNAQLHIENSVFPPYKKKADSERRKGSGGRLGGSGARFRALADRESEDVAADPSTGTTMMSRSTAGSTTSAFKGNVCNEKSPMLQAPPCKNGYHLRAPSPSSVSHACDEAEEMTTDADALGGGTAV